MSCELPVINYIVKRDIISQGLKDVAAPSNFTLTEGVSAIRLSWVGWHDLYEIQRSTDNINFTYLAKTTNQTIDDTSMTLGVGYYYRVRGYECNKWGCFTNSLYGVAGNYQLLLDGELMYLDGQPMYLIGEF